MQGVTIAAPAQIGTRGRIAALDGWRGIAILLVLFDHAQVAFSGHYQYLLPASQTGAHGVTMFLVLSGFLITTKLLDDSNLKHFYIRRFFRLMPAAWVYLVCLVLFEFFAKIQVASPGEISASLFFYRNYSHVQSLTGHFWSLSLEEQFYLVWPSVLLLAGLRVAQWIAGVGMLSCAVFRYFSWTTYQQFDMAGRSEVRADALLAGCLVALILADKRLRPIAAKWSRLLTAPAALALLFSIWQFHVLQPLFESISIAVLIGYCVVFPQSFFARWLSIRPLVWLGVVSYSTYLWQEPFMHLGLTVVEKLISIVLLLPAFALGSYYWVERPGARFGHQMSGGSMINYVSIRS